MHTKTYYRSYWSDNELCPGGQSWPGLRELLGYNLPAYGRVLDLGCGDGLTSGPSVQQRGCKYVGVDVSENGAMRARVNGFESVLVADSTCLPFDQGEFDAALCIEVFEHLFEPLAAAKEILRVLKPGALMVATVPNAAYWQRRVELGIHGLWNPLGDRLSVAEPWRDPHIRFFTPSTLGKMVERAGFERVRLGEHSTVVSVYPKSWRGGMFWRFHTSRAYQAMEQLLPDLLAYKAHAVGYRPR